MRIYHRSIAKYGRRIFMIWIQNIRKILVNALSLVLSLYQVALSYLTSCYPMVRAIGVCLSQRFSKNTMIEPMCRICRRTSYNCGTVLVIGLVCIALIGWLV